MFGQVKLPPSRFLNQEKIGQIGRHSRSTPETLLPSASSSSFERFFRRSSAACRRSKWLKIPMVKSASGGYLG